MFQQISHSGVRVQLLRHFEEIERINDFIHILRLQSLGEKIARELIKDRNGLVLRAYSNLLNVPSKSRHILLPRDKRRRNPAPKQDEIDPTHLSRAKA